MIIRRMAEIEQIETPGNNTSGGIATPRFGASSVSVVRQRELPGGNNPAHYHDREEVLVLLVGSVSVTVDGEDAALAAGDSVIIPAQAEHQIRNSGDAPAEWLIIAPAGVRFFHAGGEAALPDWAK